MSYGDIWILGLLLTAYILTYTYIGREAGSYNPIKIATTEYDSSVPDGVVFFTLLILLLAGLITLVYALGGILRIFVWFYNFLNTL